MPLKTFSNVTNASLENIMDGASNTLSSSKGGIEVVRKTQKIGVTSYKNFLPEPKSIPSYKNWETPVGIWSPFLRK